MRKVNYAVEAARLGQMTDYEKLMLEVWTNGAITPSDAVGLAAKLVKALQQPLLVAGQRCAVGASVGLAIVNTVATGATLGTFVSYVVWEE